MEINDYQTKALETAIYPKKDEVIYPTLGLAGEAGEVADKVKKVIRDNGGIFTPQIRAEIAKELGDVMWYCATLAYDIGFPLENIAQVNIDKLNSRKERNKLNGSGDNR